MPAADPLQLLACLAEHIITAECNRAIHQLQTAFQIPHGRQGQCAFARSTFAHQAHAFPASNHQIYVAQHRHHLTRPAGKTNGNIGYINQWSVFHSLNRCLLRAVNAQRFCQRIRRQIDANNQRRQGNHRAQHTPGGKRHKAPRIGNHQTPVRRGR